MIVFCSYLVIFPGDFLPLLSEWVIVFLLFPRVFFLLYDYFGQSMAVHRCRKTGSIGALVRSSQYPPLPLPPFFCGACCPRDKGWLFFFWDKLWVWISVYTDEMFRLLHCCKSSSDWRVPKTMPARSTDRSTTEFQSITHPSIFKSRISAAGYSGQRN